MTRDDIIKLAQQAGFNWPEVQTTTIEQRLERFADLVAEAEREACAKLVEKKAEKKWVGVDKMAESIRARGQA